MEFTDDEIECIYIALDEMYDIYRTGLKSGEEEKPAYEALLIKLINRFSYEAGEDPPYMDEPPYTKEGT